METMLINAGIRNLKEFGYPDVDSKNILVDYVYSQFFLSMLKETLEKYSGQKDVVVACERLINKIEKKRTT